MHARKLKQIYTFEEYIKLEERSSVKHEFHEGELYAMAGATKDHAQIITNLTAAIHPHLMKGSCRLYTNDIKVRIQSEFLDKSVYPDMVITCHKAELGGQEVSIRHPTLIIEVLSKSTALYDRTQKFDFYKNISEFQEYVLINQWEKRIEIFRKPKSDSKDWRHTVLLDEHECFFQSIKFTCELSAVYWGVEPK